MDSFIMKKTTDLQHRQVVKSELSVTALYVLAALVILALAVGITLCCICTCNGEEDEATKEDKDKN